MVAKAPTVLRKTCSLETGKRSPYGGESTDGLEEDMYLGKRGSKARKIAFMVKRNPRVLTTRDSSLGAD